MHQEKERAVFRPKSGQTAFGPNFSHNGFSTANPAIWPEIFVETANPAIWQKSTSQIMIITSDTPQLTLIFLYFCFWFPVLAVAYGLNIFQGLQVVMHAPGMIRDIFVMGLIYIDGFFAHLTS
jgi:hypothetical protein